MNLHRWLAAAALALGAISAHAMGSMADVSIVDRATRQPLPAHWHDGRAYVIGRPGAEYQVVVTSRSGEDLLAVVSVDGVNVVSGETAGLQQAGYVLRPWESVTIRGWRKSLDETAAFYFTSLGDSYAARTGRPGDVGVIGVALFRSAAPPQEASTLEPAAPRPMRPSGSDAMNGAKRSLAQAAPAAPLGTGHGQRESSPVREVRFERAAGPAEILTMYYDSYRNLVALGVIASPAAARDPTPFPARFVPDPPR